MARISKIRWGILIPSVLGGLLFVILLGLGAVWSFRRPIVRSIVAKVNQTIPGTISIADGSLTWKRFFTRLSLDLEGVSLEDSEDDILISAEHVGATVNPVALVKRSIDVSSLTLESVTVKLAADESGKLNLYRALGIDPDRKKDDLPSDESDSTEKQRGGWRRWNADIDGVMFQDCRVTLGRDGGEVSGWLEYFTLSFLRSGADGEIAVTLAVSDLRSDGLGPGYFRGKRYALDFQTVVTDGIAAIEAGDLMVEGAHIGLFGSLDLRHPFIADLGMEAKGTDTDLLLSFLPPGVSLGPVAPVGNGTITVSSSISGPLADAPDFYADIACENFAVQHIPSGIVMDEIGFDLSVVRDSEISRLQLKHLGARWPDGGLAATMSVEDFQRPFLELFVDADVNLDTLADFFVFPGSDTVAGLLDVDVDVAGRFDRSGNIVERQRENGTLKLTDFMYSIPELEKGIQNLDLLFRIANGMLEVRSLEAHTDVGSLSMEGAFGNLWPLLLGGEGPVFFNLDLSSPRINPSSLFDDPEVAASWDKALEDLSLSIRLETDVRALQNADPLPYGSYGISHLSAVVPSTDKTLQDFSGIVDVGDALEGYFSGKLDESSIEVETVVEGYRMLLSRDDSGPVNFSVHLDSPQLRGMDLLPPESGDPATWMGQGLENVTLDLALLFDNSDWFESLGHWPDGQWTLEEFSGRSTGNNSSFELGFDLVASDGTAVLKSFQGRLGSSDFNISGNVANASALFTGDISEMSGEIALESNLWNMADLPGLAGDSDADDMDDASDTSISDDGTAEPQSWNLSDGTYPNLTLDVSIGEFRMDPYHFSDIDGAVRLDSGGKVHLSNLQLSGFSDGGASLTGALNFSDPDRYILDADARIWSFSFESADIPMTIGEEQISLGDTIKGELDGDVAILAVLNPDLSLKIDKAVVEIRAELSNGNLVDFPPFLAMADRFKNRNMNNVRLDTLKLEADLEGGVLTLPKTAVGSTLGYLEMEGYMTVDSYMSFSVTVPNSVIGDVFSGLFSGGGGEGDGEDEILNAENTGRSRTTVNLVGDSEDMLFSLGKRGRPRLEDRWDRRRARRERQNS